MRKLTRNDFDMPCVDLAKFLLGKILVRKLDDKLIKGIIVETESYLGGEDKASHSYMGRRTPRNEPMYMIPGTTYVYFTYGMYHCFNISSQEPGGAVLLRALEPIEGIEHMKEFRMGFKNRNKHINIWHLCNGPSKLCISMDIIKNNCNKIDLCNNDFIWIEEPEYEKESEIITTSRIGIASCGHEWSSKPLRFYILNNKSVSKRDKNAEKEYLFKNPDMT